MKSDLLNQLLQIHSPGPDRQNFLFSFSAQLLPNHESMCTLNLPSLTSALRKTCPKIIACHILTGDGRKLLILPPLFRTPPTIRPPLRSCGLRCGRSIPAARQVMSPDLISISEAKGRDDIFCPAAATPTDVLEVKDGALLRAPPSLSSKPIMN